MLEAAQASQTAADGEGGSAAKKQKKNGDAKKAEKGAEASEEQAGGFKLNRKARRMAARQGIAVQ
jgi:hypothetical protein